MRIETVQLVRIRIPFKTGFRHALKDRSRSDAVVVILESDEGRTGLGEILPREYLTGETIDDVLERSGPAAAAHWTGRVFSSREELLDGLRGALAGTGRDLAAFGGFEIALLDLAGRHWGFPAGDALDLPPGPDLPPGYVIGFEVPTSALKRHCAMLRLTGGRHVKLKVGGEEDLARLEIVAATLGPEARIRIDANGAWSTSEAVDTLRAMRDLPVRSVEQPVPASDLEGMRLVRERTGLPVMADESLCSFEDGERLVAAGAVDIFNVRVGKCGGLLGALRLVELARRHDLACHLGTLVGETGILSRASEIFGSRVGGFECLEGLGQTRRLLESDIVKRSSESGVEEHGLGLTLAPERLTRYMIGERKEFRSGGGDSIESR